VGSKTEWADYQLRPNQCVAMVVAPELFKREHAQQAIQLIEKVLLVKTSDQSDCKPLGLKTLDPSDWNYRPNYDSADTDDFKTSKGFNYHQGPEWVWCFGVFLKQFRCLQVDIVSCDCGEYYCYIHWIYVWI